MSNKIGVIGDRESILGFSSLGLELFPCGNAEDVNTLLADEGKMSEYAVLYITENAAKDSAAAIARYRSRRTPAIILIPGKLGSLGLGVADVRKSVEKAVGADILFK